MFSLKCKFSSTKNLQYEQKLIHPPPAYVPETLCMTPLVCAEKIYQRLKAKIWAKVSIMAVYKDLTV